MGKFFSGPYRYEGYFQENKFHGLGTEKTEAHYFHGDYHQGKKIKGTFTWKDNEKEYEYEGDFNEEGRFHGRGKPLLIKVDWLSLQRVCTRENSKMDKNTVKEHIGLRMD